MNPTTRSPGTGVQQRVQPHHHVVEPFDVDGAAAPARRAARRERRGGRLHLAVTAVQLAVEALDDRLARDVTLAEGSVQRVEIAVSEIGGDRQQRRRALQLLHGQAGSPQRLCELLAAGVDGVLAALT